MINYKWVDLCYIVVCWGDWVIEGFFIGNGGCFLVYLSFFIIICVDIMFFLLGFWVKKVILFGNVKIFGFIK